MSNGIAFFISQRESKIITRIDILENMVKDGRMGKKSGKGFYVYEGKKKSYDAGVETYISVKNQTQLTESDLVQRMVYPMVNEAARCLDEKIAFRPQDVDLGMIFGTGFAPFRGGLLTFADTEGIVQIDETLNKFKDEHGQRFTPSEILQKMSKAGKGFYDYFNHK